MAEVVGLVASVIQVASTGLQLSRTLRDYGSSVQGYERRLKGLDKDIYFTSSIISELATLLKDPRVQSVVSERSIELTREIVAEFEAMFRAVEDVIKEIRGDTLGKWKIYFRESRIGLLLSNLDRLKGNLQLLIGVITHASQISTEHPDNATILAHRIKILELMVEKEEYTEKFLREKKKYDNLMVQIDSNSTLGSVSTIQTDNGVAVTWRSLIDKTLLPKEVSVSDEHLGSSSKGKEPAVTEPSTTKLDVLYENESQGSELERRADNIAHLRSELNQLKGSIGATSSQTAHLASSSVNRSTPEGRKSEKSDEQEQGHETRDYAPSTQSPVTVAISTPGALPAPDRAIYQVANSERRRKRDRASRFGKKVLKGTGYATVGVLTASTFPISLPMWWWWRSRRKASLLYGEMDAYTPAEGHRHQATVQTYAPPYPRLGVELFGSEELGAHPELQLIEHYTRVRASSNDEPTRLASFNHEPIGLGNGERSRYQDLIFIEPPRGILANHNWA